MAYITPIIGASGLYDLKLPYRNLISDIDIYTCQAIRKLADIIAEPADPFALYYEPLGLTQDDYNKDLASNVCILSLQSGMGDWAYVPNSYLNSYPSVNGVKYTSMVINVALGPIPNNESLVYIKNLISNLVKDNMGITPVVKEVAVSNTSVLPGDTHDLLVTQRNNNGQTVNKTDAQKLRDLQLTITTYTDQITALENYIKRQSATWGAPAIIWRDPATQWP